MRDGCGPLRGHNSALKRRAGVSVLKRGSQQAPIYPGLFRHPNCNRRSTTTRPPVTYPNTDAPAGSTNTCRKASLTSTRQKTIRALRPCVFDVVPHEEVAPGIAARTRDGATITRERHHRNPPRRGNSNMRDGCGPLRGHNGALKRRAGVSLLMRGSQQAPVSRACLLYTSPSPRDQRGSRMPSSA